MKISIFVLTWLLLIAIPQANAIQRIQPEDLIYQGAFRLPVNTTASSWDYSGYAMAFYPSGDVGGGGDGYSGSLFAVGHDHHQMVSEITIPLPIISINKNTSELNTATTLQAFQDITGGLFGELEIPRAGLAYLAAQGSQQTDKLHFAWGQHFQGGDSSHGWSELTLNNPQTKGAWLFGAYANYTTNDYLFEVPSAWSDIYTPGQRLASGRYRDGDWSGHGPALFIYQPWKTDSPSPAGASISEITPLLLYGIQEPGMIEITNQEGMQMEGFSRADEWSGAAWLTAGNKAAVIFVGTKAIGESWYGYSNGVVYPISGDPNDVIPPLPDWPHDDRGWWSANIGARILFYDSEDLAEVAAGRMETYQPQPYAYLDIDQYLFDPGFDYERGKRYLLGASAFDRENGILYVMERLADEDRSLVHVWKIDASSETCPKINSDLRLHISCAEYAGNQLSASLQATTLNGMTGGMYWQLIPSSTGSEESSDACMQIGADLQLAFTCVEYADTQYSFSLDYYPNVSGSDTLYWMMNMDSLQSVTP